ncbi:LysR family transcriptional regulator [Gallaecimonas mangrovi]|uniref:LysR family transcriptional regulator n=1 Tax=Gallaecimonas mangrovi TaxID=2291597 RepID=UPI000E20189C|nr:LysR family transcriptional regulator [Gallaecimonas mangrovi]
MKTTLDEMHTFIEVVNQGTISAAAHALGHTVSATSRTLARLEKKLGVTLLNRTTRRLQLTEEGHTFLERARAIVTAVDETEELLMQSQALPAGKLRVDAASPFILHVIAPLVADYQQRYPQVALELTSHEGIIDLLERRIDVAFRIGPLKDSSLHARPITDSAIRILASPQYLAKAGTPQNVKALLRHNLLGFTEPVSLNSWPVLDEHGQLLTITPNMAADNGETLRQLALEGVGIVCLSDFMTRLGRQHGDLVPLLAEHTLDVRQPINAVYYRNTAVSARVSSFIDHLSETLASTSFR